MSSKTLFKFGFSFLLSVLMTVAVVAQDTTSKTTTVVKNPDGSYTVIEYHKGKEVVVDLTPYNLQGAKGVAKVLRSDDGTQIVMDLMGVTGDVSNYYVYAIDPTGASTFLGPVALKNGTAQANFTTKLDKFMLVLSPNEGVTAFESSTPVVFRSSVPAGYAVVPTAVTSATGNNKQVASSTEVQSAYQVPMLGVPSLTQTTEIRINFQGDLNGLKGKAYIDPTKDGLTKIKMRFDDMKMAPKDKRFVLWAASADGKYTKLGQVINTGERQESEIRSETALTDFGLFVTVEDNDVNQPTGRTYTTLTITP